MANRNEEQRVESNASIHPAITNGPSEEFVDDLGRPLKETRVKAHGWLGERQNVIARLEQIRDTAVALLSELTGGRERRQRTTKPIAPSATLGESVAASRKTTREAAELKQRPSAEPFEIDKVS